jgi:hypothetical protein
MKSRVFLGIVIASLLITLAAGRTAACRAADSIPANIDSKLPELNGLWRDGKINDYCVRAAELTTSLIGARQEASVDAAVKLLQNELSKGLPATIECYDALRGTEKLALLIAASTNGTALERQDRARLLTNYLARVRSQRIPNFQWLPVTMNVAPPIGAGPSFAGMNPNLISDTAIRAEYLKAIQANRENIFTNKWQVELRTIDIDLTILMEKRVPDEVRPAFEKRRTTSP